MTPAYTKEQSNRARRHVRRQLTIAAVFALLGILGHLRTGDIAWFWGGVIVAHLHVIELKVDALLERARRN